MIRRLRDPACNAEVDRTPGTSMIGALLTSAALAGPLEDGLFGIPFGPWTLEEAPPTCQLSDPPSLSPTLRCTGELGGVPAVVYHHVRRGEVRSMAANVLDPAACEPFLEAAQRVLGPGSDWTDGEIRARFVTRRDGCSLSAGVPGGELRLGWNADHIGNASPFGFGSASVLEEPPLPRCRRTPIVGSPWTCRHRVGAASVEVTFLVAYDLYVGHRLAARRERGCRALDREVRVGLGPPTRSEPGLRSWAFADTRAAWVEGPDGCSLILTTTRYDALLSDARARDARW